MTGRTHLTTVETVRENRSWLFTIRDEYGEADEVILVPCDEGEGEEGDEDGVETESEDGDEDGVETESEDREEVEAWVNRCTHEAQRLDRGFGAAMRDGQVICPKHGSMFDTCSGDCDNGEAAGTTLVSVDVTVELGNVYLTDDDVEFVREGGIGDGDEDSGDDDGPSSTSHIGF